MPPSGNSPFLQQLRRLKPSSPDFHVQLNGVFCEQEYARCVLNLQGDDLAWLVGYLDKALDSLDPSTVAFRRCLCELRNICSARAILPASYTLSSDLLEIDHHPFTSDGYGDVYQGTLNGSRVCIKRVRAYTKGDPKMVFETFYREAVMRKYLTHPNIVPFLGVTSTPSQLISDRMPGGDLLGYIEMYPNGDRLGILSDVARGLCYLHSRNVIHGGIKGPNIVVDHSGHARIADFGYATIVKDEDSAVSDPDELGHTPRWTAPEIWTGETTYSKEADIFSFAMVMIEVFTGAVPFRDDSYVMAMLAITQGKRPPRPTHPAFTENLWKLMQRCWDHDRHSRPKASEVSLTLESDLPAWKRLIIPALSAEERIELIKYIFSDRDEFEVFERLSGSDAQAFVDVIGELLDDLGDLPPDIRRRCLRSSYRICGREGLLPKSLSILLCYDPAETPQCPGGFADVWKGEYKGQAVAAKALRIYKTSDLDRIRKV